ncbi:hypothetical protein Aperf_G00000051132 [Anoplocephala perfoliata]
MEVLTNSPTIQTKCSDFTSRLLTSDQPDPVNARKLLSDKSISNKETTNDQPSRKRSRINWIYTVDELNYSPKYKKVRLLPPAVEELLHIEYEDRCNLTTPKRYLSQLQQDFSFDFELIETDGSFRVRNLSSTQYNDFMNRTSMLGFTASSISVYQNSKAQQLYAISLRFTYPESEVPEQKDSRKKAGEKQLPPRRRKSTNKKQVGNEAGADQRDPFLLQRHPLQLMGLRRLRELGLAPSTNLKPSDTEAEKSKTGIDLPVKKPLLLKWKPGLAEDLC